MNGLSAEYVHSVHCRHLILDELHAREDRDCRIDLSLLMLRLKRLHRRCFLSCFEVEIMVHGRLRGFVTRVTRVSRVQDARNHDRAGRNVLKMSGAR
jgi:hypothetical protein